MSFSTYREIENSIEVYFKTRNPQLKNEIQTAIKENENFRNEIMKVLKDKERYILFFNESDQIQILTDLINQIKEKNYIAHVVSWMLPYISNKALDNVLSHADDFALVQIMNKIESHLKIIGHRIIDIHPKSTSIFSRMYERKEWIKLYFKCKKYLNS